MDFIQENSVTLITGFVTFVAIIGYFRWFQSRKLNVERDRAYEFIKSLRAGENLQGGVPETFTYTTSKTFLKGKEVEDCEFEHEYFSMGFRTKNTIVQEIWY